MSLTSLLMLMVYSNVASLGDVPFLREANPGRAFVYTYVPQTYLGTGTTLKSREYRTYEDERAPVRTGVRT